MFETPRPTVRFRRFRFGRATRQLDRAANVMDLRAIAKRRLPGGVFDYIDGAAEDERSLARSMTAIADIEFKPRVLRDVSELATDIRDRKVNAIERTSPDVVASANPGCSMRLAAGGVETIHPMQLIDRALADAGLTARP
ncbi:MAG: hypothetical protein CL433_00890 [Acidimicrobiaceae bacterium]|jgi:hypothetical protein|nr:hypothetical protein [Acidimicrobiaceae bacterium]HAB58064.1 hypothetical protein [Acidimicrobiaceae bacterium]